MPKPAPVASVVRENADRSPPLAGRLGVSWGYVALSGGCGGWAKDVGAEVVAGDFAAGGAFYGNG